MEIFSTNFEHGSFISRQGDVGVNTAGVFVRSERGLAWEGNGSTSKITYPQPILNYVTQTTVSWIKFNSSIDQAIINGEPQGAHMMIRCDIPNDDVYYYGYDTGNKNATFLNIGFQLNIWQHWMFVRNGTDVYFYIDNVLVGTSFDTMGTIETSNWSIIGDRATGGFSFDGDIGKIEIYDHVFTEKERSLAYESFLQAQPLGAEKHPRYNPHSKASDLSNVSNLIASYNMISQEGVLVDTSDNSGNGTVTGPISTLDGLRFDGVDDTIPLFIEAGIAATVKTVCFRIKLDSTTEQILEGGAGSIFILANAGTLTYAEYDNAYIDGVETDVIVADQWTNVVVTSSTAVSNVTATLGLNDTSYGAFEIEDLKFYLTEWTLQQAKDYHNSFAKRVVLIEDLCFEKVGENKLEGTVINSGTFELKENTTSKYFECLTDGSFSYGGIDLSKYKFSGFIKSLVGDLSDDEGYYVDHAMNISFDVDNYLRTSMTTGQKLRSIVITQDTTEDYSLGHRFLLTSTGDGSGVSTLTMTASEDTKLTLDGTARFYSDAGGTLNESTIWIVTTGGARTRYIRCPSATANFIISDNTITSWGAWTSGANAASLSGDISQLTALTYIIFLGANNMSGNIANFTSLTFIAFGGLNILSGSITDLILLTYINIHSGPNTISGNLNIVSDGLTKCILNPCAITTYTAGGNWSNIMDGSFITVNPAVGFGLSSAEVDLFIIEVESTRTAGRAIHITLTGSNAARTAASDAAVAAIIGDGGTVTTN